MSLNRMNFMNIYIDNATKDEVIKHIDDCIVNKKNSYVVPLNVDEVVRIEYDEYFHKICNNAELLLADGHPLLWIAKFYKTPIKEKICGSDLIYDLCELATKKNYSIFLLGAEEGVASKAAEILMEKYKGLKVAGTYSPPFGFEKNKSEIDKIVDMLKISKADMLFVGLGVPKQEIFVYENKDRYCIPMTFLVGASIDFVVGKQKRAPMLFRKFGFEWLYRLFSDPKRMFKRYIIDDTKIFSLALKYNPIFYNFDICIILFILL